MVAVVSHLPAGRLFEMLTSRVVRPPHGRRPGAPDVVEHEPPHGGVGNQMTPSNQFSRSACRTALSRVRRQVWRISAVLTLQYPARRAQPHSRRSADVKVLCVVPSTAVPTVEALAGGPISAASWARAAPGARRPSRPPSNSRRGFRYRLGRRGGRNPQVRGRAPLGGNSSSR